MVPLSIVSRLIKLFQWILGVKVLQNIDDLFDREELSACADVGWPDCFNSGLFVFRPSLQTYTNLLDYAITHGSFDGMCT